MNELLPSMHNCNPSLNVNQMFSCSPVCCLSYGKYMKSSHNLHQSGKARHVKAMSATATSAITLGTVLTLQPAQTLQLLEGQNLLAFTKMRSYERERERNTMKDGGVTRSSIKLNQGHTIRDSS
jgi:uncharacterized membrane protein